MKQICKSGSDVCIVWTPYFQLISLPWIYKNITGQSDFRNLPSLLHGRHCDTDMFCVFTWKTLIQTCSVYLQGGHRYRHVLCIYMEDTDTHMFCVFTWKTLIHTCSVYLHGRHWYTHVLCISYLSGVFLLLPCSLSMSCPVHLALHLTGPVNGCINLDSLQQLKNK